VIWEDGTETWEQLTLIAKSDPVTLAVYAKEHDLLDQPGWKCFRKIARCAKVLKRMINASKRKQNYNAIRYKFGVRIPRNVKEAKMLDKQNGNTYWQDAIALELAQMKEYKVLRSLGKNARRPDGYQEIPVRFVFDIKQSLKQKA
jgi:hypothetical protein